MPLLDMFKAWRSEETLNENFVGAGSQPGIQGASLAQAMGYGADANAGAALDSSAIGMPEGNFIGDSFYDTGGVFGRRLGNAGILEVERSYIMQQRSIAIYPEVAIAIEEILRDLYDKHDPLNIEIAGEENKDHLKSSILEMFAEFAERPFSVIGNSNTPSELLMFNLLKQVYIDGHMVILAAEIEDPKETKKSSDGFYEQRLDAQLNESMVHGYDYHRGFIDPNNIDEAQFEELLESQKPQKSRVAKSAKAVVDKAKNTKIIFIPLDPARLVIKGKRIYYDVTRGSQVEIDRAKIIQADFGLFDVLGARHGFLQYAFKYANQLQALQDMLIPMRFRKSIARRIFNVDVGNLPQGRAVEYMKDVQRKFRYKKNYDPQTGRIKSSENDPTQQVGIVEDYWFANRGGSKGTTVETMDEAGSFNDNLEDIAYFNKKLYQAMFIPLRRVFESESEYDYTANSIETDELRFHTFLNRLRFVFDSVFTQMFRVYLQDRGVSKEDSNLVKVTLRYDNWFEETKRKEDFEKAVSLFGDATEMLGKTYSAETLMRIIFGMGPDDIQEEQNRIKAELEPDSVYNKFYVAVKGADEEPDY